MIFDRVAPGAGVAAGVSATGAGVAGDGASGATKTKY